MGKLYIRFKSIFLKDSIVDDKYLVIEDGKFAGLSDKLPQGEKCEDYSSYIIAPGYFDTHIHGYNGHDVMDARPEDLFAVSEGIVNNGVTSFLPTTLTQPVDQLNAACKNIGDNYEKCKGAKVKGIFLEGPFFTTKYKGAQNPAYMSDPDINLLKNWYDLSKGMVRKIAIAPERQGVAEFIKQARKMGVYVALGHSDATYDEAYEAVMAGANIFVHLYNGMSPLHHRNPGMVGAGLSLKEAFAEVICDGKHVHPAAIKVVVNSKTPEKTILITDCMMAGGMKDGQYKLGDFDVTVKDNAARLDNGSLAGSVLKLKDAVKNVVKWGIATPYQAVQMATRIPAMSVGLENEVGIIDQNRAADFNVLDENMEVIHTYIDGVKRY